MLELNISPVVAYTPNFSLPFNLQDDWTIEPLPSQERQIRAVTRSPRMLSKLLNRICWNEIRGVELLTIATRYFANYSDASLHFARHAADESRHAALFAEESIELGGRLIPYPGRSEMLNMLPGFKNEEQGNTDTLTDFLCRGFVEEYRGAMYFDAMTEALDDNRRIQRVFKRVARDEWGHIYYVHDFLERLSANGHKETIATLIQKYQQSTEIAI